MAKASLCGSKNNQNPPNVSPRRVCCACVPNFGETISSNWKFLFTNELFSNRAASGCMRTFSLVAFSLYFCTIDDTDVWAAIEQVNRVREGAMMLKDEEYNRIHGSGWVCRWRQDGSLDSHEWHVQSSSEKILFSRKTKFDACRPLRQPRYSQTLPKASAKFLRSQADHHADMSELRIFNFLSFFANFSSAPFSEKIFHLCFWRVCWCLKRSNWYLKISQTQGGKVSVSVFFGITRS